VKNRALLAGQLEAAIRDRERAPLLTALINAQVPAGALNNIAEALSSPAASRMTLGSVIDGTPTKRISGNAFRIEPY
jgi:crotonobetainyl-CoA:carnitine CoA-transferase CaiB-like acyl-CoA transferase